MADITPPPLDEATRTQLANFLAALPKLLPQLAPPPPTAPVGTPPPPPRSKTASALVAVLAAATLFIGWKVTGGWSVAAIGAAMLAMLLMLGFTISGEWLGALINERNLVSLSRFQMALWTIVVLATYFAYAVARIKAHVPNALDIAIDWRLWALLGISTTTLIGSPLILGGKKEKAPQEGVAQDTAVQTQEKPEDVLANSDGTLYANTSPADARFTDMFQGDELGNTTHVDLAKVQMFYFTLIAAVAFMVMAMAQLRSTPPAGLNSLPKLHEGLIALLGISHAGYLTAKSVDHTPVKRKP